MNWEDVDWELLEKLRARFLSDSPGSGGDYWASEKELEHYDLAFAPRIGWKWDAVLREARARGWQPPAGKPTLLDWGCGTGIATRRFLQFYEPGLFREALVWDRSARARAFAARAIQGSGLPVVEKAEPGAPSAPFVLLASHVLGELTDVSALVGCVQRADSVFWVEPGTPALSRRLIALREQLRETFQLVAPCPHQGRCGLAGDGHPKDWCHHFAEPPAEVFQSGDWARFGQRLRIDRRSLPVSFLVLQRRDRPLPVAESRVLGRPRIYKGYAKLLVCSESGVDEITLRKRDDPTGFKDLETSRFSRTLSSKK